LGESLEQIKQRLRDFAAVRDWDQFLSPKNLAMPLIVETAELVEYFQWLKEDESAGLQPDKLAEVELELADIQIYLIRLADKLSIDLLSAVHHMMARMRISIQQTGCSDKPTLVQVHPN